MANPPVKRDERGRLVPGSGAINPGGKYSGIEKRMRELVGTQKEDWDGKSLDGWEALTMMMYAVAMGKRPPGELTGVITMKDRQAAAQFLFDRVYGKAKIQIESDSNVNVGGMQNLNIDALTPEELDALDAHVEILAARTAGKATGKVLDISTADVIETEVLDKDDEP